MESDKNQNDPLIDLLEIVISRKLLIVIGFLSVLSVAALGAILMPPLYAAYTTIYIDAPTLPRLGIPYMEEITSKSFLKNQKEIIKSRFILEKVVGELKLDQLKAPPKLLTKWKDKIYQLLSVSKPMPNATEKAIKDLGRSIRVHLPRGTNIVNITVASNSPKRSALLANTLAKEYIQYANNLLFKNAQSGYSFIEEQVEYTGQRLVESEKALIEFKEREMVISIDEENSIVLRKLAAAEEKSQKLRLQIANLERKVNQIKLNKKRALNERNNTQELYENPEDRSLNDKLNKFKYELVEAKVNLTEEHPDVKALRNRIALIENRLKSAQLSSYNPKVNTALQDLNLEIIKLKETKDNLSKQIKVLLKRREELTTKQFAFEKLAREFKNNQNTFRRLKEKLDNAGILKAAEVKTGSIKIIDRAYPPPYSNKKKKMILLAIGTIIALCFGLGMAFTAEYLDDSLKTPDAAEKYLHLPVLGTIPTITRKIRKI